MVNNNKILTVSYGTFSCTLEGFDDSFDTMKAIAEYFRDLASDDRYFGAEPPQLDAEMLARIAQRQISSPVAAYESESGIVLRAAPADSVTQEPAPVANVPKAAETPAAEHVVAAPAPEMPVEDAIAAVVEANPENAAKDAAPMPTYVEPEIVQKGDIVPAADSIAAKLQRIRAVVSRNEASAKGVVFADDEQDDPFLGTPAPAQDSFQNVDFEDEDLIPADDPADETGVDETKVDDFGLDLSKLMSDVATQDDDIGELDALDDIAETDDHETEDEVTKALAAFNDAASDDDGLFDDDFGDDAEDDIDDEDDDLANLLADVRATNKPAQPPASARVVKIKRTDFEAAIAAGQIETVGDADDLDETSLSDEDEAELLRELAEVEAAAGSDAAPELDANADDDAAFDESYDEDYDDEAIDEAGPEDPLASDFAYDDEDDAPAKSSLPPAAASDEGDLSRLMDAADTKMDEPETSSRLEAYSHLRAAVAVANAEHAAGGTVGDHTDDGAYREDLANVVRPRRPEAIAETTPTKRPNRPVAGKPAPLKLVAEQRVDDQVEQAQRGPVRPRRVSAVQVDETFLEGESKVGFAQFAQEMDATDLPDLLEAAAAYMSFVEGRAQFSRPQLMTKVRQIETSNFNREDGLRSFGKLLREGKIQKTGGGRFTASEHIGFRPDERAAG